MKRIISIILIFASAQAHASFSSFAVVTPETESKYKIKIEAEVSSKNNCTVKFSPISYPYKHAWLFLTTNKLSREKQNFRKIVWRESKLPSNIITQAKLNPITGDFEFITIESVKTSRYEVTISNKSKYHAYIYIDYPHSVLDGGYYYSIDLGAYCGL